MIRVAFHVDNFEKIDNNLYTLLAIYWNKEILKNKTIVFYDNNYGSLEDNFKKYTNEIYKTSDLNSQLCDYKCRLIYKFENIKEGEKSILYNVTEVPLMIHNPILGGLTNYNFENYDYKLPEDEYPVFKQFKMNIQQGMGKINTYGYLYDNNYIMILHGDNVKSENQKDDIFVNYVPNLIDSKITNMKRQMGIESNDKTQIDTQKDKYKYKLTCNWMKTEDLYNTWSKMFSNGIVDLIHTNGDDYDFLIIINRPNCDYVPEKSIVYRMEPYIESNKYYNDWIRHPKEQFAFFMEHSEFRNNTEWWISNARTFNIEKSRVLSAVISSQYDMVGHKFRIDFIKYLQQNGKHEVDTYGYSNKHDFKNYKGSLPEREKDNGLFPYKYTIGVENCDITNYFSEKIYDAIISECLCFYWGCNNVEEFIDSRAFIRLDKDDLEKSLKIVEEAIANDEWSKRIDIIRKEKRKIINNFNIFTRTASLIYINRHMKFYTRDNISFIRSESLDIKEIDMSKTENNKQGEFMLRNYDNCKINVWEYSNILHQYNLWKQCASDTKDYCIMSGKATNNFIDHLCVILSQTSRNFDVIGLHEKPSNGYIISPAGARKLLNLINTYGIYTNLDNILTSDNLDLKIIRSYKDLVYKFNIEHGLKLHLFKQIDGVLNNSPQLFNDRRLKTDADNTLIVLDF